MFELFIPRTVFVPTLACNLRCKLCAALSPYYAKPYYPDIACLYKYIDRYFEVVHRTGRMVLSGGEPLLHKDLHLFVDYLYSFENRIDRLEIITNGTIVPSHELIESLRPFSSKLYVMVDNYGYDKSINANSATEVFSSLDHATVTLIDYYSDKPYYGGWVDYGIYPNTQKKSIEYAKNIFSKCAQTQKMGFCMSYVQGSLYPCAQLRALVDLGVIPDFESEAVNLFDPASSDDDIRLRISDVFQLDVLSACAYCNGVCDDSDRFKPAEQLNKNEINWILNKKI